jgi:hypothetical protein
VLGDRIIDTRSEWRTFANDDGDVCEISQLWHEWCVLCNGVTNEIFVFTLTLTYQLISLWLALARTPRVLVLPPILS